MKWLIRIVLAAAANALTLWIASLLFDNISIDAASFIIAVAIFTVAAVAVKPIADNLAGKYASGITWVAGLATTFVALALTNYFSDGLSISGVGTWIGGTVVVWLGTLLYDLVDDKIIASVGERLGVPDIRSPHVGGGPQQATG